MSASESKQSRTRPAKTTAAGANMSQSMPSPSTRIPRADGMLQLDSPTESKVIITCNNKPGDNFCYMDSVLFSLLLGTQTGPRLLESSLRASGGLQWSALKSSTLPGSVSSPVTAKCACRSAGQPGAACALASWMQAGDVWTMRGIMLREMAPSLHFRCSDSWLTQH